MKLQQVSISDFGSYRSEQVDFSRFDESEPILIVGENRDVAGANSNGCGKCVDAQTYIFTNKGIRQIRELQEGQAPSDLFVATDIEIRHPTEVHHIGIIPTIRLRTRLGFELEGGLDNHRIIALDNEGNSTFRYLRELKVGDYVGLSYGYNLYGNCDRIGPYKLDEDLAYLIGVLVGDGCVKENRFDISCAKKDEFIVLEVKRILHEKSGLDLNFRDDYRNSDNWHCYTKQSQKLKDLLSYMPEIVRRSYFKRVPSQVLQAPKCIQAAFLSGLFDTDGSVSKTKLKVTLTQNNLPIIQEIRMMLLNMGIISRYDIKKTSWQNGTGITHRLNIGSVMAVEFAEIIGFRLQRKQELLLQHVDRANALVSRRFNTNYDKFPLQRPKLLRIMERSTRRRPKPVGVYLRKSDMSRTSLRTFLDHYDDQKDTIEWKYLDSLVRQKVVWLPIESLQESSSDCWDLTVPSEHRFISGGFISHNSTLLHSVCWCLFGKLPVQTQPSVGAIIREEAEVARVNLRLTDGKEQIEIERFRGKDKGLVWSVDGKRAVFTTDTETQNALLRRLGFQPKTAFSDFCNSAYFSGEAMAAFTSRNGSAEERMAIIARFLGLDIVDKARDIARDSKNRLKGELTSVSDTLAQLENQYDASALESARQIVIKANESITALQNQAQEIRDSLKSAQKRDKLWSKLREAKAASESVEDKYDRLEDQLTKQIQSLSTALGPMLNDFEELTAQLEEAEVLDMEFLEESLGKLDRSIFDLQNQTGQIGNRIENQKILISRLQSQIEAAQECPSCSQPLQIGVDGKVKIFNRDEMLSIAQREVTRKDELEVKLTEKTSEGREFRDGRVEVAEKIKEMQQLDRLSEKKLQLQSQIQRRSTEVETLIAQRAGLQAQLQVESEALQRQETELTDMLTKYLMLPETNSLLDTQTTIDSELIEIQKTSEAARRTVTEQEMIHQQLIRAQLRLKVISSKHSEVDFWATGFPIIRKWQIDRFIPEFEGAINRTLSQMNTGMRLELSTVKERKRAPTDEDSRRASFSLNVFSDRGTEREFEVFSMGEARRIGMAVGFSLREITLNRGTNRLEFLMIDELVDHLDELGMEAFFRLLPTLAGLKLIISHDASLSQRFTNVIRVVKENGISRIANN